MKHENNGRSILLAAVLWLGSDAGAEAAEAQIVRQPSMTVIGSVECQTMSPFPGNCTKDLRSPRVFANVPSRAVVEGQLIIDPVNLEIAKITDLQSTAAALETRIVELEGRLRTLIAAQEKALSDVSNHLVNRIDQMPLTLVRDDKAIALLQARLAEDGNMGQKRRSR